MKAILSVPVLFVVLGTAIHFCHSTGEFLVMGLGTALLLDRYYFGWLLWTRPINWTREITVRSGTFLIGTAGFYLIRLGSVPPWEAITLGATACLVLFLLESCVGGLRRIAERIHSEPSASRPSWRMTCARLVPCLILLILAMPLEAIHPIHTVPRRTPAAQGLEFEDVRFAATDGLQLTGWLLPHYQARGNVVFCHGHGRNRGHAGWLLPTLHDLRLNVLAFDFRGHGDSPGHESTFGHQEVRDLIGAARYLRERCPDQPLFVIGVSLGAAVTLQALPELGDVCGVWSEGCFGRLSTVVDHYFAAVPKFARKPLVTTYSYAAWLDCGIWAPDINPVDSLARVHVPICFCHGKQDELVPFEEAVSLYETYAGPKWNFWVEDGNHYNLRQVARDEYLAHLRSFLEDRLSQYHPEETDEARTRWDSARQWKGSATRSR